MKRGSNSLPLLVAAAVVLFSNVSFSATLEIVDHKTDQEGLFNNAVNALAPADSGAVFIATNGGLHIFIDYYFLPIFQNIPGRALVRDPDGSLWAVAGDRFLYHVSERDGMWSAARIAFTAARKITAVAASRGFLAVGTASGLYAYDDSAREFRLTIKGGTYTTLAAFPDGTIVAGATDREHPKGGLEIIGGSFGSRTGWIEELAGQAVSALVIDAERLYVGTRSGRVFVRDEGGVQPISLPGSPGRITAFEMSGSMLLVGAERGLYTAAPDGTFELLSPSDVPAPSGVTSLAPGKDGTVWVGTEKDGVFLVRVRP